MPPLDTFALPGARSSVILTSLSLLTACAVTAPPAPDQGAESTAASPLQVGVLSTPSARPWAAFVTAAVPGGTLRCSGALIAPNKVLTSARCTACSSSAVVTLLGEAPGPGTVPLIFHPSAPDGFTTHPAAFKAPVTCAGDAGDISSELLDKRVDGHALGIIRLASSVNLPVAKPLLQPPIGFAPAQDLHGADRLTVVSGGTNELFGGSSTYLMREATFALARYSNQFILPDCDPSVTEPFTLQREMVANVGGLDGDTGGAWLATVNGTERLIGVAQALTLGLADNATAVFQTSNASFIAAALGSPIATLDADGDDVPDVADNCPNDANRDQIDRDEDGVGDVCDNCAPHQGNGTFLPGPLDTYDPAGGPYTAFANPDQANCNADAEDREVLASGGSLGPLTDAEYLASFGSALFTTCQSSPLGRRTKQRRGDACDPVPCAATAPRTTQVPTSAFGPFAALCGANGYAIGICSYEAVSGWDLQAAGAMPNTVGSDGLRFCRCDLPHATAAQRRLFCAGGPSGCAIDASLYQLDHPKWKKLDLVGAGPDGEKLTSLSFPAGIASVAWNYLSDLTALTGVPLPPQPWALTAQGELVGGPKLRGVLWSHVVHFGGQAVASLPPLDGRDVPTLASHYTAGDHRFVRRVHWRKIPRYKPHYWWEYCAGCGIRPEEGWLEVVNDPLGAVAGVVAFGLDGGVDVTGSIERTALSLLSAGTHVNAAEPEQALARADVTARALVLRPGSLDVIGVLRNLDQQVVGDALTGTAPALAAGEAVALTYSAQRGELFAFRQVPGRATSLQRYSQATGRWSTWRLLGAALGTPMAATLAYDEQALYLLDRGAGTRVRLVRIGLDDGVASVIDSDLFDGSFSSMSIAARGDGELLCVVADGRLRTTFAAHLRLPTARTPLTLIDRATVPGEEIAGEAAERGGVVTYLVRQSDGFFAPRALDARQFERVDDGISGPVF